MVLEFRFPDVGEGIAEGEIVRWLVKEGEVVRSDQPLVEVETDKAVVEIPAPRAGTVLRLGGGEGEKIRVGDVLVVIGDADAPVPARTPASERTVPASSVSVVGSLAQTSRDLPPPPEARRAEETSTAPGRILAIPSVRKLAQELGVDHRRVDLLGRIPRRGPVVDRARHAQEATQGGRIDTVGGRAPSRPGR